ncbi:MAG TPA: hypothetical protein VGR28_01725 [Candidatus Thermoplasmatota archaeon]|jgi:hypothetical protein|nr:hypothetical protein [Candidatus Thermoplasmatota archaeon]
MPVGHGAAEADPVWKLLAAAPAMLMFVLAVAPPPAEAGGSTAAVLVGGGADSPGGWQPFVVAATGPGGVAAGYGQVCLGACSRGVVVQVVPPGAAPHWCVTWERADAPGQFTALYVRGATAPLNEFSFTSGFTVNCTTFPNPLGSWLTLQAGGFVGVAA